MAVNINVPSQVKTYANLAAFPATGALKTIYIAEDTNKTYRWTGSVYTEISASAAMTWGAIGGTLSNQTDLQSALDAKVPTSRTLTINGVTQDLSANRTFTISTGITIGSTAITSGTVGRILFEGAGNVVQESGNLFWDNTNSRLGIGTSTPTTKINIVTPNNGDALRLEVPSTNSTVYDFYLGNSDNTTYIRANSRILELRRQGSSSIIRTVGGVLNDLALQASGGITFTTYDTNERMRIIGSTGNVLINTTTDAGFRLDVNGTARVVGTAVLNRVNFSSNDADGQLRFVGSALVYNPTGSASLSSISAAFELTSTTKGFLPPRMTTTQKNAIATPAAGLMVYDTTLNVISYYNGTMWV